MGTALTGFWADLAAYGVSTTKTTTFGGKTKVTVVGDASLDRVTEVAEFWGFDTAVAGGKKAWTVTLTA